MPIHKVDYPAITICSHGQVKEVLDNALNKQFEDFVLKVKGKKDMDQRRKRDIHLSNSVINEFGLSTIEVEKLKKEFMKEYYPGLEMNQLVNLVALLTAEDPERTIEAKILTDPEAIPFLGKCFSIFKLSPQLFKKKDQAILSLEELYV